MASLPAPPGLFQEIARAQSARAYLEIDLAAIRHNVDILSHLSYGAKLMAVLKGDGYGLGARVIGPWLQSCGIPAFAVDNVAEGIELRASGVNRPVLIIDGDLPDNAPLAIAYDLTPGIAQEDLLLAYERAAEQHGRNHPIWLVVNAGFNRSGYRSVERFARFALQALACRHLEVLGVYAHLTDSYSSPLARDATLTDTREISQVQIAGFRLMAHQAKEIFGPGLETSLFASHGLVHWAKTFSTDWVRPGILLYGEHAFDQDLIEPETAEAIRQFQPAVRLRARISHLLDVLLEITGAESAGFGQHHTTKPRPRLATVSMGFGSGYPCGAKKLHALVHGQRVPLFNEVGMDNLLLNVTGIPEVQIYDWVTLLGADGGIGSPFMPWRVKRQ